MRPDGLAADRRPNYTCWGSHCETMTVRTFTVTYRLSDEKAPPPACFGTLHLWGGTDLANVPTNPEGIPVPGQFPYSFDASGSRDHTFTIPIADRLEPACNAALSLYIVSHAEVDLDCNPETTDNHETAFGGDLAGGSGNRWWFYGNYTLCCPRPVDPPVSGCTEETAWGGTTPGTWTGLVVLL